MAHSKIPPSSAHIWGAPGGCTGWVKMAAAYPGQESEDSKEGDAAHALGARMIEMAKQATTGLCLRANIVGKVSENGVVITEEIYDSAATYAEDVIGVMRATRVFGGEYLGVEARIEMPRIHAESYGTTDAYLYAEGIKRLYIWDFKHGHEVVEVFENWQVIDYLAGLFDKFDINGFADQRTEVHARIVQPRAFHRDGVVREWVFKASDIRGYINILAANAEEALGPDSVIRSGPHCKYCTARHACPAALKAGLALYEAVAKPIPVKLSAEATGVQFAIIQRAKKQLEYLEAGFQGQIMGLLRRGEAVAGYRLEEGLGRERWARPVEEIIALGSMLDIDLSNPQAKTPNQARKLGVVNELLSVYAEVPKTGLKLVPDNLTKARKVFSK